MIHSHKTTAGNFVAGLSKQIAGQQRKLKVKVLQPEELSAGENGVSYSNMRPLRTGHGVLRNFRGLDELHTT